VVLHPFPSRPVLPGSVAISVAMYFRRSASTCRFLACRDAANSDRLSLPSFETYWEIPGVRTPRLRIWGSGVRISSGAPAISMTCPLSLCPGQVIKGDLGRHRAELAKSDGRMWCRDDLAIDRRCPAPPSIRAQRNPFGTPLLCAADCGSGGRWFNSPQLYHLDFKYLADIYLACICSRNRSQQSHSNQGRQIWGV
jgi:hypothetical protein